MAADKITIVLDIKSHNPVGELKRDFRGGGGGGERDWFTRIKFKI